MWLNEYDIPRGIIIGHFQGGFLKKVSMNFRKAMYTLTPKFPP